jgi:hypothetical protein
MIASSSQNTLDVVMSLDKCGTKDLKNHSSRNVGGTGTLIKIFWRLHSQDVIEDMVCLFLFEIGQKSGVSVVSHR